jgi:hypothetical protein
LTKAECQIKFTVLNTDLGKLCGAPAEGDELDDENGENAEQRQGKGVRLLAFADMRILRRKQT